MSQQLPATALRKLEQTLAQWQQWKGASELPGAPHLVRQMGGISNYTVLVEAAGLSFTVRLDRVNPAANGINRQVEWTALQRAYEAGIAPRPRYFNPEIGTMVCDYLPPDNDQTVTPESLAGLLRKIHQLPGVHYRLDLAERFRRYRRLLSGLPSALSGDLEILARSSAPLLSTLCAEIDYHHLCHHDISSGNLLRSGGRLYALDWEYCAMGNAWFDLATSHRNTGLGAELCDDLLKHYLQRAVRDEDRHTLAQWSFVGDYLDLLWYLSQRPGYLDQGLCQDRATGLLSRLEELNRENC